MKALVIGALLLRTLHAQDCSATSDDSTAVAESAPLLTPGPDAPAESDIVSASSDRATDDSAVATASGDADIEATAGADAGSMDLPVGTADIIVEPTPTESDFVWPIAEGGASDSTSDFVDTAATSTDDLSSSPTDGADAAAGDESVTATDDLSSGAEATTMEDAGFDTQATDAPVVPDFASDASSSDAGFGAQDATDDFHWADATTATDDLSAATATATDESSVPTDFVSPSDDGTSSNTATESFDLTGEVPTTADADAAAATDGSSDDSSSAAFPDFGATATDGGVGSAEATGTAEDGSDNSQPSQPGDNASATPTDGVSAPDVTLGASNRSSVAGVGADGVSVASPQEGGSVWSGENTGNYDGQDYGDDGSDPNEECPASCYDSTGDDTTSLPAEYDGSGDDSIIKRFLSRFRRRQTMPSSGGFASFQWPTKKQTTSTQATQDCNPDIPDGLYQATGGTPTPCKPKCPASCYASSSSDAPAASDTPTSSDESNDDDGLSDDGSSDTDDGDDTSGSQEYISEDPVDDDGNVDDTGDIDTDADPAVIAAGPTPTTFATSTSPAASPAGFTGSSLDTICPKTCTTSNPATNKCDDTTSCTSTGGANTYCACRAGFKPSAWNPKDISKMFKAPGQPFVYIAEGVVCDMVCSDLTCSEVFVRPACA